MKSVPRRAAVPCWGRSSSAAVPVEPYDRLNKWIGLGQRPAPLCSEAGSTGYRALSSNFSIEVEDDPWDLVLIENGSLKRRLMQP